MRTKNLLSFIALLLISFCSTAQTQFWSDNFEDAGSPSIGSRTATLADFACTSPVGYFKRTTGTETYAAFTGFAGSKFFAAMNVDLGPTCTNNSISAGQTITWSNIDITGKTGLSFKGLFGANSTGTAAVFQGTPFAASGGQDSLVIQYRINGGAWVKLIGLYSDLSQVNAGPLRVDTDGDLVGDGATMTSALSELSANITGTGTTLDLRFCIFDNNGSPGSMAIDNFRLFSAPACNMTASLTSQTNVSCNGGSNGAAVVAAANGTGTLAYNWTPGNPTGDGTNSVTGLTAQVYTCTITDANSCTATQTVSITQPTAITSSVTSQTNVACNGGSTGAATITASGGTGTLTYDWTPGNPTGDGTNSVTGLTAGIWTCTITDANSCTKVQTVSITQSTAISSSLTSQTNIACNGGSTGAATITASGGAGSLTYNWTPGNPTGDGTNSVTGLTAGIWTCTITDANSCTKVQTVSITQPTAISSSLTSQTNIACNGGSTGAATITASGGTGTLTYSWAPSGGTSATATGLSAGIYTVTITDANSCTKIQTVAISQPTAITSSVTSQTNVSCNGGTNGAGTITASGGTGTLTYSWAPSGGTSATATGLSAGIYTVTITDANTCTKIQTVAISQPTAITSSVTSQTNVSCNGGTNGAGTITASGGTGTLTYSWAPSGGTSATATGLSAGIYTVTITDANTCTKIQTVAISQPTAISSSLTSQTNIACNGGSTGAATITASGGTGSLTYIWAPSGGTSTTATGLSAGIYTVTITDANSCTKIQTVAISQPTAITSSVTSQTNVSCNGGTNGAGTITASGGTGTLTYSWAPSGGTSATATGLSAGIYTVTITDANSCTKTQTVAISQPTAITSSVTSQTNVSCNGGTNGAGTITASGGTGTLTYSWAPSGGTAATATGLSAGIYTVTITDANSCTKTQTVGITQSPAITSSVTSQTNVSCNGGTNGAGTITAGGGAGSLTYSWAPSGGTSATATGLSAGIYTVTITDVNSCTKTQTVGITQSPAITSSVTSQTNVSCNGGTNGAGTITASGGTGTLTYSWAPSGGTAATATGLSAGIYTVTITDANTCTKIQTVAISQPTAITSSVTSQTNVSCNGGTNGAGTITASGGTGTLTYSWAPSGGTSATATGLSAGIYTVTITDANSCTKTQTVGITQSPAITSSVTSQTNVSCNGGTNGAGTITASGGTGTLTYSWAPSGGTSTTATGLSAGIYTVTITDANTCTKIQTVAITQPTAISSSLTSQTNIACNGGSTGAATITASGGAGSLTYNWTPGNPTGDGTNAVSGLLAGVWTCTITDANSCTKIQTVNIAQPSSALQALASNDTNSCSGANVALSVVASGGTPSYSYNWVPGNLTSATPTVNPTTTTSYVVTVTDANSCTKKDTVVVSVGGVLAQANQTNSISIDGADTSSSNVLIGNLNFCYNEDCKIIASVKNNAALGNITAFVTVVDTVPVYQGRPYLPRWYKITPANNIAASVNLYFTQQDFDDYNVYAGSHGFPLLPQNSSDQVGIDSLVVTKVSGGDINSGTGVFTLIHPDSVKWNATLHFWTVSLQVPSFSEFFVHANNAGSTPLIVSLSSFTAKKENSTVGLYWTTVSESDNVGFAIERSNDGKSFHNIGNVNTKAENGNSSATLNYTFVDKAPLIGMNYYRLAEQNKAGLKIYTDVRSVNFDNQSVFNCYPNPTSGVITVEHIADKDEQLTVRFTDVLGKVVLETKMSTLKGFNRNQIDMNVLSQGMYNMTIVGNSGMLYNTRITKK